MNIIRNNTTVEYQILMRQLAMRNEKDHTSINRIQEIIQKYKLEPVGARPPAKNMIFWRKIVIFHTKYPKNFRASLHSAQFWFVSI
jgi:hypothetical protein